ncbi:MAG: hypothetical protein JNJ59_03880 [Deltaproteobacteria bacterium]|nr:hypothetical protein [Deltaproteobacteria bacterium]
MSKPRRLGATAIALEQRLQGFGARVLLSVLILLSLLPHPGDQVTDLVFLVVFGIELTIRAVAFMARGHAEEDDGYRRTRRRVTHAILLLIDLVALLSFVPWSGLGGIFEGRWLRLLRLSRMMLLVGYWAPLLRDTWTVLTRHDRMRQVTLLGLVVGLLAFAGATVVSQVPVDGIDFDGNGAVDPGDASFWPRLWWAFRQVQDPGNMIENPGELTVVLVSLVLTVAGLFVVSFLIGLATDIVRELVLISRNRPLGWKGHTVIVHATPGLPRLLGELTTYYERLFRRQRFVVADHAEEPPAALRSGELAGVRWRTTDQRGTGLVAHTDVATARRVVVLSKPELPFPDAHAAATVLDVREANVAAWVVAEILDPNNIAAARVAGGARTVVVPSEKLFGVWALAAIRRPTLMSIAWELLATRGGAEVYTCFFDADGLPGPGAPWVPPAGTRLEDLNALALSQRWSAPGKRARPGGVVPVGVFYAGPGATGGGPETCEALLAPAPGTILDRPVRALVAVADHFALVERFGQRVYEGGVAREGEGEPALALEVGVGEAPIRPKKVLLCGFRPATVVVCAGLLADAVDALEIVLVMRHEDSVRVAAQTFREHGLGATTQHACFAGSFTAEEADVFRWAGPGGAAGRRGGRVRLVRADWTSERTLSGLEAGVEHVAAYDTVLLLGSHEAEYDGRTAMAVLKIADLLGAAGRSGGPRVVAGVADAELGRRLADRFHKRTGLVPVVLEAEELRALFVFQSIAVPGWETIYLDLLAPGGRSLLRLPVTGGYEAGKSASFKELARAVRDRGVLIAVESRSGARLIAPAPDEGPWALEDLAALIVIG